jgi:hypothetical protein
MGLNAAAVIVHEKRAADRKAVDDLRATIAKPEERVAQIEQRGPSRSLRAVGE